MKILIIAHNALDRNNNMGRTLEKQFCDIESDELAQLYLKAGVPKSDLCKEFFRLSDVDVFKSIFTRKAAGCAVDLTDVAPNLESSPASSKLEAAIRKKGNRRSSIYFLRNVIWYFGKWRSAELDAWLDKVSPDVIYFASGDYSFAYDVALYIAKKLNIPLIIGCYDDYFIGKKKTLNPFDHIVYKSFMKHVKAAFDYASLFTSLSEKMTEDYEKLFKTRGETVYVPTTIDPERVTGRIRKERIIYAGNIGNGRAEQLAKIGRCIRSLGRSDITHIDVYSGEGRAEPLSYMTEENGIAFHGKISPERVEELMCESKYVLHVEAFDYENKRRVAYSVSTKTADCLSCGACMIAFGPDDVALIEYLKKNEAAWVISDEAELCEKLTMIFDDEEKRDKLISNAFELSKKNHDRKKNGEHFAKLLSEIS